MTGFHEAMVFPVSLFPTGSLTYPLVSHRSVPKNTQDKPDDLTSYAASHIRLMIRRIAANPIVAEKEGRNVSEGGRELKVFLICKQQVDTPTPILPHTLWDTKL